jgi:L-threonylcarbamoyladenylate synthase
MTKIKFLETQKIIDLLNSNHTIVLPTDTVYGICTRVNFDNLSNINTLYEVKKRDYDKPPILLFTNFKQLDNLKIQISKSDIDNLANKFWSDKEVKNTLILPIKKEFLNFLEPLHRGKNQVAIRRINPETNPILYSIIENTGILASSSANLQGQKTICSFDDFKESNLKIEYFIDDGLLDSKPSNIYILDSKGIYEKIR